MPREIYRRYVRKDSPFYNHIPPDVLERCVLGKWVPAWSAIHPPTREMSQAARASIRRKRMEKRMQKKYPLFAKDFIRAELERRPQYFSGEGDPAVEQLRQEVLDRERAVYEAWKEQAE
jgi:hypothetical protein